MSFLRRLLVPLAPLYEAAVRARNRRFELEPTRTTRVGCPVVSVGNLSTGGTGKTPVTLFLAQELEGSGWNPAVLSRGYGGRRAEDPMAVGPESDPGEVGDEPLLMARRLGAGKVVVARSRIAGARQVLASGREGTVLLLDDGFQHRALHRDLDLLLLDGVRRWGNGRMLPRGDLREPMDGARRAHALVVTRGSRAARPDIETWWERWGSGGPIFFIDFRIGALRAFQEMCRLALPAQPGPLFAFCALGHPDAFYADLLVAGLPWLGTRSFRDHRALSVKDLSAVQEEAASEGAIGLICTEKDAVKLGAEHLRALTMPLWVAEQEVVGGGPLLTFVKERLAVLRDASSSGLLSN